MERIYFDLDKCESVSIQAIARNQEESADGVALLYDGDGELVAGLRIVPITDGRGRFFGCSGKLAIIDRAFGKTEFPLIWRPSNLGRGGFWNVQGVNHTARKIYRTPKGWRTLQGYKSTRTEWRHGEGVFRGHCLYSDQRKSHKRREGRGVLGIFDKEDKRIEIENYILQPFRKTHYRGRLTPYGRRALREFAKREPLQYNEVQRLIMDYFPDEKTPLVELFFIREMVNSPQYNAVDCEELEDAFSTFFHH